MLIEEQQWYYLIHSWGYKEVHTFFKSISLKLNLTLRLKFNLTYFKATAQNFRHYAMETTPKLPFLNFIIMQLKMQRKYYNNELVNYN